MTTKFKSPTEKLVRFFEKSRDKWKARSMERKKLCRKLSGQVRAVESSREKWKQKAKQARKEADKALKEAEQLRQELEELKSPVGDS